MTNYTRVKCSECGAIFTITPDSEKCPKCGSGMNIVVDEYGDPILRNGKPITEREFE